MVPMFHVTDHLGNVRTVVDITDIQRWTTPDPLAEKYYDLSPYAFCANNPINFVDPDGRYIISDNIQEWNDNKRKIKDKVLLLQQKASKMELKGKSSKRLNKLNKRIKGLNQTLATMTTIENSSQGYSLSQATGEVGGVQYDNSSNLINISYVSGSTENFIHEVTHAGQFETGDIAFSPESGKTLAQDIYDEVAAYKAQKYYSGGNPDKITARYVQNIRDPKTGELIYTLSSAGNTSPIPISIRTPYWVVRKAYLNDYILNKTPFYKVVNMHYKTTL